MRSWREPPSREALPVGCHREGPEALAHLVDVALGGELMVEDAAHDPLSVDDVRDALAHRQETAEHLGVERLRDRTGRVGEEAEGETVLLGEARVALRRVATDPDHLGAVEADEVLARVAKRARLARAPRGK